MKPESQHHFYQEKIKKDKFENNPLDLRNRTALGRAILDQH